MNRQIRIADYKYVVLDDPLPPGHVTQRMRIANFAFKMAHSLCFQPTRSATDQDRIIKLAVSMRRWISTQI